MSILGGFLVGLGAIFVIASDTPDRIRAGIWLAGFGVALMLPTAISAALA